MEGIFHGEDEMTVDEKGRMSIPAHYRDVLGPAVYLGRGLDGQINVYPTRLWESMAETLRQADQDLPAIRNASRFVLAANLAEFDRTGRVTVPNLLRRYAGITNMAVVVGNLDRLEIWSPDQWLEKCAEVVKQGRSKVDDPKVMDSLGLKL